MAGYVMTLNNLESLKIISETGVYSTFFKDIKEYWSGPQEGTLADFLSMKPGDNIYFFHKRKIYGIGELIEINGRCIHLNFPEADLPQVFNFRDLKKAMLVNDNHSSVNNRFACTFIGNPAIFCLGVDMDEILLSNPHAFKMLRSLWKLSFIKIDDIENKALFDVLLKANEIHLKDKKKMFHFNDEKHNLIKETDERYVVTSGNILKEAADKDFIKHEMAIEAAIIDYINRNTENNVFGKWDYISHQVIASPFKPIDYMDKIDVYGYRFIEGYKTISEYLMIEIKKGKAKDEVVNQAMKYVDWIEQEYSHDYNMIKAYIVAYDFDEKVIEQCRKFAKRYYTKGRNPALTYEWRRLSLITYRYNDKGFLEFKEVEY